MLKEKRFNTKLDTNSAAEASKRSEIAKRNRAKRKGITPEGREKQRQAALRNQPWKYSTGPRTAAGKARVALNGKVRQIGPRSLRELQADVADLRAMAELLRESRMQLIG